MSEFKSLMSEEHVSEYISSRITQLAQSGYQLELDLKVLEGSADEESILEIKQQIDIVNKAIQVYKEELEEKLT